jgi:hypothetical protein
MKHRLQYFLESELIDRKFDKPRFCIAPVYKQVAHTTSYGKPK